MVQRGRLRGRGGVLLPVAMASLLLAVAGAGSAVKLLSSPEIEFFATRQWAVGSGALAVRWVAIAVAAGGMAGVWVLLRRRFAPVFAAAACLAMMATPALDYSYDARTILGSADGLAWLVLALLLGAVLAAALARYGSRRAAGWVVATLFLAVGGRQAVCGRVLLHQRHAFFQFRNGVERAAAPGEVVAVSDAQAAAPLYWYGSPELRNELVQVVRERGASSPLVHAETMSDLAAQREEKVLVGEGGDWLCEDLRARGYVVAENEVQVPWERLGGVRAPLSSPGTRLFLATPAARLWRGPGL